MSESNFEIKKIINYDEEEEKGRDFEPIPYTFKIPNKWKKMGDSSVISPPNWLLLDHTIAVIWSLFNTLTPSEMLDIDDLKWAHEFLKDVRNAKGDHPPDVKTCLMEIQDHLITLYAQLTRKEEDATKEQRVEEVVPLSRQKTNSIEVPKITKKKDTKPVNKESFKDIKSEPNCTRKFTKDDLFRESRKSPVQQRRVNATTVKTPLISGKRSELSKKETWKKEGDVNFFSEVFQRNRTNDRVLGEEAITNSIKKKSVPSQQVQLNEDISGETGKDHTQNELGDVKISLEFKRWVTDEELNNEEQAYGNLKNEIRNLMKNPKISKDEVFKFLSKWREEQVERLQSEVKRLNSIEQFMRSVKMEGFVPYLQDDFAKKLASITCKKITNKLG